MIKIVTLVFAGGAVGAVLREFAMLTVPNLTHGFPLDILVANLLAASMLGFVTALHNRRAVSDAVNSLIGTGFTGGLSTFSSFVYGSTVLATASTQGALVAFAYVVTSLVMGYTAVIVGMKLGAWGPHQSGGDRIDLCLASPAAGGPPYLKMLGVRLWWPGPACTAASSPRCVGTLIAEQPRTDPGGYIRRGEDFCDKNGEVTRYRPT